MSVSRSWTGEDDILFFLAVVFATVLFARDYWHRKIADVTCDDLSGETPFLKFSKKGEGGQKFSHKKLGVLSKKGVSLIFTLTNAFWYYLYQCVFFICINHSISFFYVFFMVVLRYIYVCVRAYQYIGPWVCCACTLWIYSLSTWRTLMRTKFFVRSPQAF